MANRKIGQAGLNLIKQFEGCRLSAYQCAAGVWTIGYGHTAGVKKGMTITQAQADARVIRRSGCCADWRDRPENSAALCSDGYLVV